jgi:hypothetical protein
MTPIAEDDSGVPLELNPATHYTALAGCLERRGPCPIHRAIRSTTPPQACPTKPASSRIDCTSRPPRQKKPADWNSQIVQRRSGREKGWQAHGKLWRLGRRRPPGDPRRGNEQARQMWLEAMFLRDALHGRAQLSPKETLWDEIRRKALTTTPSYPSQVRQKLREAHLYVERFCGP